jgi:hypothetical protein
MRPIYSMLNFTLVSRFKQNMFTFLSNSTHECKSIENWVPLQQQSRYCDMILDMKRECISITVEYDWLIT